MLHAAGRLRAARRRSTSRSSATRPGRVAARPRRPPALRAFVKTANRYRGTYNVTALNWFGLRDNNSAGPNFQSFFGLLRDDYSPKPASNEPARLSTLPFLYSAVLSPRYQMFPDESCAYQSSVTSVG